MERVVEEVRVASPETTVRDSTQSIRIYANSDVYALLADVEEEITRMGELTEKEYKQKEVEVEKREAVKDEELTLSATIYEGLPARTYTPPVPYKHQNSSSTDIGVRS
jgi:hypothetical protein